jgi:hypothetical protein
VTYEWTPCARKYSERPHSSSRGRAKYSAMPKITTTVAASTAGTRRRIV